MTSKIINNILKRVNRPDLLTTLADELSGTELNSILLEAFNRKIASVTAPELLNQYQQNRFVKPADLPVLKMKQMELDVLKLFEQHSFHALELSPVSILGSCSVMGYVDQKKVLSALRGTEVIADSTNAMALHACDLKQRQQLQQSSSAIWMRCSSIQRQVRTQTIIGKGFRPHFKIGCVATFGNDTGGYAFEKTSLFEHMKVMKSLFLDYYKADSITFRLLHREGYTNGQNLLLEIHDYIRQSDPDTYVSVIDRPVSETNYYKGIQYKADIEINGEKYEIADGGFVDWTQQLLQNKKERMLSTGFGFDIMHRIQSGEW